MGKHVFSEQWMYASSAFSCLTCKIRAVAVCQPNLFNFSSLQQLSFTILLRAVDAFQSYMLQGQWLYASPLLSFDLEYFRAVAVCQSKMLKFFSFKSLNNWYWI